MHGVSYLLECVAHLLLIVSYLVRWLDPHD
jgi:hypothetical protein